MTDRRPNTVYTEAFENCKPDGFVAPVVIRRSIYPNNTVKFHYWGRAQRWLPISRDRAAMAISHPDVVAR